MANKESDELSIVKKNRLEQTLSEMSAVTDALRDFRPAMLKYAEVMATIKMDRYRAYTAVGFNDAEALELVIGDGDNLVQ